MVSTVGVGLRDGRQRSGLTLRAAANRAGISAPALRRYEVGVREAPAEVLERLAALYGRSSPAERVRRLVGEGGKSEDELLAAMADPTERRALRAMLASGDLCRLPVERVDALGRHYARPGIFAARTRAGLDRSAPVAMAGEDLAASRRRLGMSAAEMAERVGVAVSTYQGWEATRAPKARTRQVSAALGEAPSPAQLRRLREDADWSLERLGQRVGVGIATVHAWEFGRRRIPPGRLLKVLGACEEMAGQQGARLPRRVDQLDRLAHEEAGIAVSEVRHRLRRRRGGAQRRDPFIEKAIRVAAADGRLQVATVTLLDALGRPKTARRLYPRGGVPAAARRTARTLSGDRLRDERRGLRLTQRQLSRLLGVSAAWVSVQERRHEGSLSPYWTSRLRSTLDEQARGPTADERASEAVLVFVAKHPGGVALWRVKQALGHGAPVSDAIDRLVASRRVVRAAAWDSVGRRYRALYLAGTPRPSPTTLAPGELRRRRRQVGLTAADLGELVGVCGNTVTRWETGVRAIPARRFEALDAALVGVGATERYRAVRQVRVSAVRSCHGARSATLGGESSPPNVVFPQTPQPPGRSGSTPADGCSTGPARGP